MNKKLATKVFLTIMALGIITGCSAAKNNESSSEKLTKDDQIALQSLIADLNEQNKLTNKIEKQTKNNDSAVYVSEKSNKKNLKIEMYKDETGKSYYAALTQNTYKDKNLKNKLDEETVYESYSEKQGVNPLWKKDYLKEVDNKDNKLVFKQNNL
ncbi:hypothetical protein [Enterococcus faecalis]|uniref:Lipoprotein n=1 Tax=Enterococcus faecalis RP2S-4 TaxID=1244145 RepID=A0ABC9TPB4_ENTFL|nr:hypothetical protein [Enterococcus faecalis]EPI12594.1 hypothetical protein D358_00018 [Enterococcus faecalis RP2S-4]